MNLNIGLGVALALAVMFGGYEHYSYKQYQTEVIAEAAKQKVITDNTNQWNDKVIKETNDAYQKRLAAINTKYGSLHYPGGSPMPPAAAKQDPSGTSTAAANNVSLERDCTITTNMLVSLQDIIKDTK